MKKVLLSVFAIASSVAAFAQCTPNEALFAGVAGGKLLPDTATFNNDPQYKATVGQDFTAVFNLKTITDTTVSTGGINAPVKIISIKYLGMDGAPAGTTVVTDQADDTWENAGTAPNLTPVVGCATVTVPASALTAPTSYNLTLRVDLFINVLGQNSWYTALAPPLGNPNGILYSGYRLDVGQVGFDETAIANGISINPNPFSENAEVVFSLLNNQKVNGVMTDISGKVVKQFNIDGRSGINKHNIAKENLGAGVYFLTLVAGEKTITRKVSIQ